MASSATKRIWYSQYACEKSGDFPEAYILIGDREVADPTLEAWSAFNQALTIAGYDAVRVGTYNCRPITGGSKLSLHAYGIAVDIDPFALGNPYYGRKNPKGWRFSWSETKFTEGQVIAVESIRTNDGKKAFLWGGRWNTVKDYMHWEIDVPPSSLATGINWATVPGGLLKGEQMLKKGDKGFAVERYQNGILGWNSKALPLFGADGDFGDETVTWVKKYQAAANLDQTGMIDGITGALLLEYVEDRVGGGGITEAEGDNRWVRRGINVTSKFN